MGNYFTRTGEKKKVKINIEDCKYLKHHPFKYKQINNHIPEIEKIPNKRQNIIASRYIQNIIPKHQARQSHG
jgi:hypothetical protein